MLSVWIEEESFSIPIKNSKLNLLNTYMNIKYIEFNLLSF